MSLFKKKRVAIANPPTAIVRRNRRGWRALLKERRSVTMIEFAIVGPVFVFAVIGLFEFGYLFTTQLMLDAWAQSVARQIQIGLAQQEVTSANFTTAVACPGGGAWPNNPSGHFPIMSVWLNCNYLLTYITSVTPDYYTQGAFNLPMSNGVVVSPSVSYCNAQANQLMALNMVYMAPVFLASALPQTTTYLGSLSFPLYSTAAFGTENYPGQQPATPC